MSIDKSTNKSNCDYIDLVTVQSDIVYNTLQSGNVYKADYNKIGYKQYVNQYKKLAEYLGLNSCPIFCIKPEDTKLFADVSGARGHNENNGTLLELRVPKSVINVIDYYDWSDYLFYSSGEFDDYLELEPDEALNNIDKYIRKTIDMEYPQIIIDEIKPEWLIKHSTLNESKKDFENFEQLFGDEFLEDFLKFKHRLQSPKNDIYYWIKLYKDKGKVEAYRELNLELNHIINTKTKKDINNKAREGAKLIYEDDMWKVYHITSYEAAVKYGANTKWCISGNNSGDLNGLSYWNNYQKSGSKFYFYICKDKDWKYSLLYRNENDWTLYNDADYIEVGANIDYTREDSWNPYDSSKPNFPFIKGLPDINAEYDKIIEMEDYDESLNEAKELSSQQAEYFKNSKVRDEEGNLIVCYHGTQTPGFNEFNPQKSNTSQFGKYKFDKYNVNYFTSDINVAQGYTELGVGDVDGERKNIYACYLNIENPFIVDNKTESEFRKWSNVKDNRIRDKHIQAFEKFCKKWFKTWVDDDDLEAINRDLHFFNHELRPCQDVDQDEDAVIYDLWDLGNNSFFGAEHEVMRWYYIEELFSEDNYEELRDCLVGDYEENREDYYYTLDNIVKWVLLMNEEDGTNYDGIIVPDIADVGPKGNPFSPYCTDYITLKSGSQIKAISNVSPTSSNNINEVLSYNRLYHKTAPMNAVEILKSNTLKAGGTYTSNAVNGKCICFSRDYNFIKNMPGKSAVIFVINKNKLASRYKITPITDYKNFFKPTKTRFKENSKAEEICQQDITDVLNYVDKILVTDNIYDDFIDYIKDLNINKEIIKQSEFKINEELTEGFKRVEDIEDDEDCDVFITDNIGDVVRELKNIKWEEYKFIIDDKYNRYIMCDPFYKIHMEAFKDAIVNYWYPEIYVDTSDSAYSQWRPYWEKEFDKTLFCLKVINSSDKTPLIDKEEESYKYEYIYDNFHLFSRVKFDKCSLYSQLGTPIKVVAKNKLDEATRNDLLNKSRNADSYKDQSNGKNRYERRLKSKIATSVAQYNKIDMDAFFKRDILTVGVEVKGELHRKKNGASYQNTYVVSVKFNGVLKEIAEEVKRNNGKLEFKVIAKAMSRVFNSSNVFVKCTCPDFKYRQAYWASKNGYGTQYEPRPSNITNPNDTKGGGCKHILLVLSNLNWMMKVASVVNNYIKYCQKNLQNNYATYIFPKIYGVPYQKAVQLSLFDNGLLPNDQELLTNVASTNLKDKDAKGRWVSGNKYRFTKVKPEEPKKVPGQERLPLNFDNKPKSKTIVPVNAPKEPEESGGLDDYD
jgi:hypothetical protein